LVTPARAVPAFAAFRFPPEVSYAGWSWRVGLRQGGLCGRQVIVEVACGIAAIGSLRHRPTLATGHHPPGPSRCRRGWPAARGRSSQYIFRFFTGQKLVPFGDQRVFLEWFPHLAEIGRRCRSAIESPMNRGGLMASGPAKVIDNTIIGFMQAGDTKMHP
jgi:hypothetical protein